MAYSKELREKQRNYRKTKIGKFVAWKANIKKRYKITYEQYLGLLELQGNVCAICGTASPGIKIKYFCIDHDHSCCNKKSKYTCGKCLRGLLCNKCNANLGFVEKHFSRILQYLKVQVDLNPKL